MGSPKKIPLSKEVGQDWEAHREKGEVSPKLSSDELDRLLGDDTTDSVSMDTATSSISVSKDTPPTESPVSMDTPQPEFPVSKDTIAPKFPVSMDTQMAENAVSKDTIPDNDAVSKDTNSSGDAVSKDTDRAAYQRDFRKKRYKTVSLDMRPEEVERFKECANAHGLSMTEFFRRAANAYIVSMDTAE